MNTLRCQGIAQRLNRLLLRRFGLGLDPQRLLADALYRRDVLLVCDAHPGTDLASLAQHFRLAQAAPDPALGPPARGVEESPGLVRSRPRWRSYLARPF